MSTHQDDLDLLLSLEDRVDETPPASPSNLTFDSPGFLSDDDGSPRRKGKAADLSVFKDAVRDCLDYDVNKLVAESRKSNQLSKKSNDVNMEKYSGLRISNQQCTPAEFREHFSGLRFVRLSTIKNSLAGDSISGSWVTVGVLTEKGNPRTSSVGKSYSIWKFSCLDETSVSVFLFGDAYKLNSGEKAGTVFGLFNCAIRKDNVGSGISLSVFSPNQILKLGTSVDYGVCKGKKKDGIACSLIVNKSKGIFCKHHNAKSAERHSTMRAELKGRTPINRRGIYMVDPLADKKSLQKPVQPIKLLSVEGIRKALSNGEKVITNTHSQGMRFLNEVAGKLYPKNSSKVSGTATTSLDKRKLQNMRVNPLGGQTTAVQDVVKRMKTSQGHQVSVNKAAQGTEKMIELDLIDSDEES